MKRDRPEWWKPADDLILEYLVGLKATEEELPIADATEISQADDVRMSYGHVKARLNVLADHGWVKEAKSGFYMITEDGMTYLSGSDLELAGET